MSTEAPSALRADACPEPEQLAAYIDGTLTPAERTLVERHLVECAECREVVADSVAVLNEMESSAVPASAGTPEVISFRPAPRRRPAIWWAGVGVALAAAAAIVLFVSVNRTAPVDWTPLTTAGGTRTVEPRVSVMTGYGPPPAVTRSGGGRQISADARLEAARLDQAAQERPAATTQHNAGLAKLLTDDVDGAVPSLRQAAAESPGPAYFSDLSAALLVQASRGNRGAALEEARAAADRALALDPSYAPALFNLALILEQSRAPDAGAAWQRYLQADAQSGWATEARDRLSRLGTVKR